MVCETLNQQDRFSFLRNRAMQLLDGGQEREAKELLTVINEEQLRRIAMALRESFPDGACTEN